jgi:AcrR family transcriptional regulator
VTAARPASPTDQGSAGSIAPDTRPVRRLSATERRQQLFAVALELFAERGYRATTMDDVAEAAGVTKPLVYQHFSSKRALYLELVDSVALEVTAAIGAATRSAVGPRQQVELGFAAYFSLVIHQEAAFRLLYGRDHAGDEELGDALRRVEDAIAEAIYPLMDAELDHEHRRLLAYAVVGMAEGASRHWVARRAEEGSTDITGIEAEAEAQRLGRRLADLSWAGLRSVHAD